MGEPVAGPNSTNLLSDLPDRLSAGLL